MFDCPLCVRDWPSEWRMLLFSAHKHSPPETKIEHCRFAWREEVNKLGGIVGTSRGD